MLIKPCVAGKFYPADPDVLRKDISKMLDNAEDKADLEIPKAIIAPHAGYIYSGPIAASAYTCLKKAKGKIKRVAVLAPSHQYPINGLATTSAAAYLTPLGKIPIDQKTISDLSLPYLNIIDEAFGFEHSLEVHLPFLQSTLEKFDLIPILIGRATINQVEELLKKLWDDPETLIAISSDLSHFHPYDAAKKLDQKTARAIVNLNPDGFTSENACGSIGVKGLLAIAAKKNIAVSQIDLRNSGDTTGSKDRVVGYGSFHFR